MLQTAVVFLFLCQLVSQPEDLVSSLSESVHTNAFPYLSKMYFIKGKSKLMLSNYIMWKHISTSSLRRITLHALTDSWLKEKTATAGRHSMRESGVLWDCQCLLQQSALKQVQKHFCVPCLVQEEPACATFPAA